MIGRAFTYAATHFEELIHATGQHLALAGAALALGLLIGLPLGLLTSRSPSASRVAVNLFNSLRVIPSLAVLFLAIPILGLSFTSAVVALTLLALPSILVNTDAAFRIINPAILEAARGLGMQPAQSLRRVEIPLALPVILAGVRTALVEVLSSATLAAFIGSGGLGIFITRGFALYDLSILLVGAVPVALLTLSAEGMMVQLQRIIENKAFLTPGRRIRG